MDCQDWKTITWTKHKNKSQDNTNTNKNTNIESKHKNNKSALEKKLEKEEIPVLKSVNLQTFQ